MTRPVPRREPIAPGQEADRYPKCKEFNRNVNHLPNMFHGGGRRLGGVQTTMVYGLLLLVLIPWLNADIQIGVSLIQLYRFGDASYTLQSALFGVGLVAALAAGLAEVRNDAFHIRDGASEPQEK